MQSIFSMPVSFPQPPFNENPYLSQPCLRDPSSIDHCLETIRLSVIYVPDLTECVRWDPLNEWMASRHYNLNDLALGSELEVNETV